MKTNKFFLFLSFFISCSVGASEKILPTKDQKNSNHRIVCLQKNLFEHHKISSTLQGLSGLLLSGVGIKVFLDDARHEKLLGTLMGAGGISLLLTSLHPFITTKINQKLKNISAKKQRGVKNITSPLSVKESQHYSFKTSIFLGILQGLSSLSLVLFLDFKNSEQYKNEILGGTIAWLGFSSLYTLAKGYYLYNKVNASC